MEKQTQFIIVTGLSGAGKTFANKCFEDLGFYCIDNLPPQLIPDFVELLTQSSRRIELVSLVLDIRGGEFFDELFKSLDVLEKVGHNYSILFLDSDDDVLVRRYKETRRKHPLSGPNGSIQDGIASEREKLAALRKRAKYYIDTSNMSPWKLKQEIVSTVLGGERTEKIAITLVSFGFKHGIPLDADMLFDVRFLPNPYYDEKLKHLNGENPDVYEYVMRSSVTGQFFQKMNDLVQFVLPHSLVEGKANLVIGIGCTGGHHRSVVMTIELGRTLSRGGYEVTIVHRDLAK